MSGSLDVWSIIKYHWLTTELQSASQKPRIEGCKFSHVTLACIEAMKIPEGILYLKQNKQWSGDKILMPG
jgi:hypothetical protein